MAVSTSTAILMCRMLLALVCFHKKDKSGILDPVQAVCFDVDSTLYALFSSLSPYSPRRNFSSLKRFCSILSDIAIEYPIRVVQVHR